MQQCTLALNPPQIVQLTMAQTQTKGYRDEVLAASRHRSGSTILSNPPEVPPPSQPPANPQSSFTHMRTKFEDPGGQGQGSGRGRLGPMVNRIKEMFQGDGPAGSGSQSGSKEPPNHPSGTSVSSNAPASVSNTDRSPESKRTRIRDATLSGSRESLGSAYSRHLPSAPDLLLQHSQPNILEATTHVERFNYTRRLFAKMEEESRLAQEREKVMRRKLSPTRTPTTPPPGLSPRSPPPMSPTRKVASHDDVFRLTEDALEHSAFKYGRRDRPDVQKESASLDQEAPLRMSRSGARSDRENTSEPHEEVIQPTSSSHVSSSRPATQHSVAPASSASVTLRSHNQRSQPDVIGDNIPGDRTGKYIKNFDLIKPVENLEKKERAAEELQSVRARVTGGLMRQLDSESSSGEHSTRRGRPPPTHSLSSSSSTHSSSIPQQDNGADTVTMRNKSSVASSEETAGKRISKEEIDAAIRRADNYLSTLQTPAEEQKVKRRSWDERRQRDNGSNKRYSLDEQKMTGHSTFSQSNSSATAPDLSDQVDRIPLTSASISQSKHEGLYQGKTDHTPASSFDIPPPPYESSAHGHVQASKRMVVEDKPPAASKPAVPPNKPSAVPRRVAPPPPIPSTPPKGDAHVAASRVASPPTQKEEVKVEAEQKEDESTVLHWGDEVVSTSFASPTEEVLPLAGLATE